MDSDEFQTPPEDTFKILIATDNHLGYAEKSSIRGSILRLGYEYCLMNFLKVWIRLIHLRKYSN